MLPPPQLTSCLSSRAKATDRTGAVCPQQSGGSSSAVTGEGLLEGFEWCVKDIGARIYMHD